MTHDIITMKVAEDDRDCRSYVRCSCGWSHNTLNPSCETVLRNHFRAHVRKQAAAKGRKGRL
jgi:hypothetical protein